MDAHGLPVRVTITEGTRSDCKAASALINGIVSEALLADRGYDTNALINQALAQGMEVVIPPKKTEKSSVPMIKHFTRFVTLLKMLFYI